MAAVTICSEYSGLISFRINWLVLLAVQGTLKSLLQHQNLKGSILLLNNLAGKLFGQKLHLLQHWIGAFCLHQ